MRISDGSSDVCSSDLREAVHRLAQGVDVLTQGEGTHQYLLVATDTALEARLGAAQRQLQLAHDRNAFFGHAVGGLVGRDAVALGDLVGAGAVDRTSGV